MTRKATPDILGELMSNMSKPKNPEPWALALPPKLQGGDFDREEWTHFGEQLGIAGARLRWVIGDWIIAGAAKWGDMYAEAERLTGHDNAYLRDCVYVSRAFELSLRNDNLSWSHHKTLAPVDDKAAALQTVEAERLSVAATRQRFTAPKPPERQETGHSEPELGPGEELSQHWADDYDEGPRTDVLAGQVATEDDGAASKVHHGKPSQYVDGELYDAMVDALRARGTWDDLEAREYMLAEVSVMAWADELGLDDRVAAADIEAALDALRTKTRLDLNFQKTGTHAPEIHDDSTVRIELDPELAETVRRSIPVMDLDPLDAETLHSALYNGLMKLPMGQRPELVDVYLGIGTGQVIEAVAIAPELPPSAEGWSAADKLEYQKIGEFWTLAQITRPRVALRYIEDEGGPGEPMARALVGHYYDLIGDQR